MSPLAIQLLRRLAVSALVLAALLVAVPRVLTELGVIGPGVQGEIDGAARALEVARAYGAKEEQAPLAAALRDLERARQLAARGEGREARRAAATARQHAIEAQQAALTAQDERRRRAEAIVADIDRLINGLEDLYAEVTPGLDKASVAGLFSRMKRARQDGAGLLLAYEQGNYEKVIADEKGAREALLSVQETLRSARRDSLLPKD